MPRYESFRSNAVEAPIMRRWIVAGLFLSLLLHAGLIFVFYHKELKGFAVPVEQLAPRPFNMKRVSLPTAPDPEEARLKVPEKTAKKSEILIPQEKPQVSSVEEMRASPQISEMPKQFLNEKPKVELGSWDKLAKVEADSRGAMERELNSMAGALLKESARMPNQPMINLPPGTKDGDGVGSAAGIPGRRTLDDALANAGPLTSNDGPIGIPGGALFEYNSYDLLPEALDELRKLGTLIERNPEATFRIEGHTDHFGTPEYNVRLSEMRAESVKVWLVELMGIAPDRIQTIGFGSSQAIVSAEKSKEEQAPNRRVEIVVKTNRKPALRAR